METTWEWRGNGGGNKGVSVPSFMILLLTYLHVRGKHVEAHAKREAEPAAVHRTQLAQRRGRLGCESKVEDSATCERDCQVAE